MTKIKRVLSRGLRRARKTLQRFDRSIKLSFTKFFRVIYRVKFLRPLVRPVHRFVHHHYRITAAVLSILIVAGVAIPVLQPYLQGKRYELNAQAQQLLGTADKDLVKKLTYDDQNQLYQFNKDGKKTPITDGNPLEKLKSQVGGGGEDDNQLYSVDIAKDLSKGVTYYDNQMQLSFKLVPQFNTMPGEQKDGHLIYPLNGTKGQLAYTTDASGLKENVVLYESPGNSFVMDYKLDLPKSLEARLIPQTGEIGIYSADPALFGNISYGSSDDQARVEAARNNSKKTYLTFKIPAPIVLGTGGINQKSVAPVDSHFQLNGDTLRVVTKGLDKAEYPLSIDPTVTVDSSSDFQTGNMEDNNLSVSSGDLNRGTVTGGSLGSYSNGTLPTSTNRMFLASVAYNGYMYVMGGYSGSSDLNTVYYASINTSTGALGTWTAATNLPSTMRGHSAVVYNGYMYVVGGYYSSGSTYLNSVYYTPINTSDGSLGGSWTSTSTFSTIRAWQGTVTYNGYMYILGGQTTGDTYLDNVQYAPINANGSLGTWQNTTVLTQVDSGLASVAYNGYIYVIGGDWSNNVQYAPINANGTIGSWISTSGFTNERSGLSASVYNGYIYVGGGYGWPTPDALLSDVQYAPINANGSLGTWTTTTALPTARYFGASVAYNGYFYYFGGQTGSGETNQIRYAAINPPGYTTAGASTTSFTTGRERGAAVAYNGYLYTMAGRKGSSNTACRNSGSALYCNDTQYAPINANGTIGSWTTGTYFTTPRYGIAAVAYNGYMYILGGNDGSSNLTSVQSATINASTGALGTWGANTALGTARREHSAVVYNGYVYVLGGNTGSAANTVSYASINTSTGVIGTWTATTAFTTARLDHASVVYGGYIYVIGGTKGTSSTACRDSGSAAICNDVQYAALDPSTGAVGTWTTTTYFSTARDSLTAAAQNGYMYIMGGNTGSQTNDFQYAPINSDGSTGTWSTTSTLVTARSAHSSVVYGGYIYTLGGFGGGYLATTEYTQINNGGLGSVGSWTASNAFTTARSYSGRVAYNGYMYILGGLKGSASTACRTSGSDDECNDVQYAPINSNGSLGTWAATTSFSTPRYGLVAVAYNGYMYVMGGYDGGYYDDVQYAPINSNGTIGSWTATTSFTTARASHAAVAYNGYMYVMGGYSAGGRLSSIYYAPINSDGTIGSWTSTTAYSTGTYYHAAVAYNGYMYVIGGFASTYVATVQYAPINSNGTIGSWTNTTFLRSARYTHAAAVYNGYLYVSGGYDGSAELNSTEYAPINTNGTLGQWQSTTGFTTAREAHGFTIYNGYMYVMGGYDGSYYNTTQYAPINSMPRTSRYSKVIDFSIPSNVTNIAYTGTLPGGTRSISYRLAGDDGVFGSTKNIADGYSCSESGAGHYMQILVTLDDNQIGTFRDALNTNNAKVSSLTIDTKPLTAPPDKRLRHGAWFYNNVLQPFTTTTDICS